MADGLLGKLRALQRQLSATVDNCDGNYALMLRIHESAADELADLLPAIIAQVERDAKDAADVKALVSASLVRAWSLGQMYAEQGDGESFVETRKADATLKNYQTLVFDTLAAIDRAMALGEAHGPAVVADKGR